RPLPLSPKAVSKYERIFASGKIVRINTGARNVCINFGADLTHLVRDCQACIEASKPEDGCTVAGILKELLGIFENESYIVWSWDFSTITICIKKGGSPADMLKAWMHALVLADYHYLMKDSIPGLR